MPFKIKKSSKSPPVAKRNPLRNTSYDVVPISGPKEYPSRAFPARTFPPQFPPETAADIGVSTLESLSPSTSRLDELAYPSTNVESPTSEKGDESNIEY